MKRRITQFVYGTYIMVVSNIFAQSTCTLDPVFVASPNYGIWPDSATNFVSGQVGVPYAQNITIKVPLDTVQTPIKICFTRMELLVPPSYPNYNLPPGLSLTGNPSSLQFPGNANSCAIISGTPTTAGTYTLHFQVDVYGTTILSTQNCPTPVNPNTGSKISTQNIDYYIINISPASGIQEMSSLQSVNISPNPASNIINFSCVSQINNNSLHFQIRDLTGKTILSKEMEVDKGENNISIDVTDIQNGIYFYSISDNSGVLTDKILINK